jgi:uncharacterized membrane protein YgcG
MKKSFLKTFIVLAICSLLIINTGSSFFAASTAYAVEEPPLPVAGEGDSGAGVLPSRDGSDTTTDTRSAWQRAWDGVKATRTPWTLVPNVVSQVATGKDAVDVAVDAAKSEVTKQVATGVAKYTIVPIIETFAVAYLKFFQLALGVVGSLFDLVLQETVIDTVLFDSISGAISNSWKLIRDIANIAIVFSLLYLAIKTILNGNGFADTKTLAGVLVAAILINFSLFFTQIAFNTSNFVSKSIAQQITFEGGGDVRNVSANIARLIGTKDIIDKVWNATPSTQELDRAWSNLQSAILAGFTMLVLIVILFVASMMLLYRFLIFIFLMISSPIGLISVFIPWFRDAGQKWWSLLKHQVLFLPAFFITLYIAMIFIGSLTKNVNTSTSLVAFFLNFILTCGFLLATLIIPTKIAGGGSNMMTSVASWGSNKARSLGNGIKNIPKNTAQLGGRAALSASARTGRYLGGNLLANKITKSDRLKALATNQDPANKLGGVARALMRQGEGLKGRTFDARNINGLGKKLGVGEGIESWNSAVKKKKDKLEARKATEEKLFGYDKMADTTENKGHVAINEVARDAQAAVVKREADALKQTAIQVAASAASNGGVLTSAQQQTLNAAQAAHDAAKKELERRELEVGKLKNKGDVEYMKLVEKRNERIWNTLSLTEKQAIKKMQEELEKKWKEDGKFKEKKKKNNNNGGGNNNNGGGGNNNGGGNNQGGGNNNGGGGGHLGGGGGGNGII